MKEILVKTEKPYKILIGENIFDEERILEYFPNIPKKVAILWDEKINPEPIEKLGKLLEAKGTECIALSLEGGEKCKTIETYTRVISHLTNFKINKNDVLIAFGGGSVLDLAGFVAATYLRGINVINVPTTLLSAVDASIGGKTALNFNEFKNIIGVINQPSLVLIDLNIVKNLNEKTIVDGASEIIKMAFINDKSFVDFLKEKPIKDNIKDLSYLSDVIERAVAIKQKIVEKDEKNEGERNILNFGHTFGHAIETESKYAYSHGVSVSLGMVIITKMAENGKFGDITEKGTLEELKTVLKINGLKVDSPFDLKTLVKAVIHDKKVMGDEILLALPSKKGEGILKKVKLDNLK